MTALELRDKINQLRRDRDTHLTDESDYTDAIVKLVVEAEQRGQTSAIRMMQHHATLHGLTDQKYYADHWLKSHEQVPEQPLDSETLRALGL